MRGESHLSEGVEKEREREPGPVRMEERESGGGEVVVVGGAVR